MTGGGQAKRADGRHNLNDHAMLSAWTTPQAHDVTGRSKGQKEIHGTKHGCADLVSDAALSSWATPKAEDSESAGMRVSRGVADTLTAQSSLCGWASPSARDRKDSPGMAERGTNPDGSERVRLDQLPRQANLAGWPTPMAGSPATEDYNAAGNTDSSRKTVELAAWPRPNSMTGGQTSRGGDRIDEPLMAGVAQLASWPTPDTGMNLTDENWEARQKVQAAKYGNNGFGPNLAQAASLGGPVRLTASGAMLTGSDAAMESSGQLRAGHSRWLQGIPAAWDVCADMATASLLLLRKPSSKPISTSRKKPDAT
jgi:hypothetical protein